MMKAVLQKIFTAVRTGINPVFMLFLAVSLILWFANELSHRFTADITVPVEISETGSGYEVRCRVEGTGYRILKYRWFPGRNVQRVNAAAGKSAIDMDLLLGTMAAGMPDVRVLSIVEVLPADQEDSDADAVPDVEILSGEGL